MKRRQIMEPADLWKWHPRIALSFRHVILWLACAEASASRQMAPLAKMHSCSLSPQRPTNVCIPGQCAQWPARTEGSCHFHERRWTSACVSVTRKAVEASRRCGTDATLQVDAVDNLCVLMCSLRLSPRMMLSSKCAC